MFEGFTVKTSKIGHTNTSDLFRGDGYLGSYKSIQDLMLDLSLKWGATEFVDSRLWSFNPIQIPKYRGVFRRWFEPIDFGERLITFSNSLTEIINYLVEQDDFCRKNEKYFSSQGTGIHRFDPQSRTYTFWKGGEDDISELTDLIIEVKQSDEVKPNPIVRATREKTKFEVFISKKTADYPLAKKLYDFLVERGISVFLSEKSLPSIGGAEYMKEIDDALESSRHLIVVGSSIDNISSSWVEAEWRLFINEKRSGRKNGNVVTMVSGNLTPQDIPMSLRYYEVMTFNDDSMKKLLNYLR